METPPLAGPFSDFLPPGADPAPVSRGLAFAITLSNGGASISGTRFELKVPGNGLLALELEELKLEGGALKGSVGVKNKSGAVLMGLRLDLVSVTETVRGAKTPGGADEPPTKRPMAAALASPILFGDETVGGFSSGFPFRVAPIAFGADTELVTVIGVVSGLVWTAAPSVPGQETATAMDLGLDDFVYFANGTGLIRSAPRASKFVPYAELPGPITGVSLDRKANVLLVSFTGGTALSAFPASGTLSATARARKEPSTRPFPIKTVPLTRFSVARDGSFWTLDDQGCSKLDPDGRVLLRVSERAGPGLLAAKAARALRATSSGGVLLAEPERITELDAQGRLVRVWGRGGKPSDPSATLPGELRGIVDLALAPDGFVHVLSGSGLQTIRVYRPF